MNERIRELVVESGNGQMRDGRLYPHIGSRTEADWQRFSELIVEEVLGVALYGDEFEQARSNVKLLFGVE